MLFDKFLLLIKCFLLLMMYGMGAFGVCAVWLFTLWLGLRLKDHYLPWKLVFTSGQDYCRSLSRENIGIICLKKLKYDAKVLIRVLLYLSGL